MINVAVFNDTRHANHYGCDLVMRELISLLEQGNMRPVWFHPVGQDWRDQKENIPRAPQIDAVIVNGEGSIHTSASRPRAVFLTEVAAFCKEELKLPCFLINATIRRMDEPALSYLKLFDRIYVREAESIAELAQYNISAHLVPDLTLQARFTASPEGKGVCVTDSVLVEENRSLRALAHDRKWPFTSMAWGRKIDPDTITPKAREKGLHTFSNHLSAHKAVVTGRFHTVTFCLALKKPFIAVESNTNKISALLKDVFGHADRVVPHSTLGTMDFSRYDTWSEKEQSDLSRYLDFAYQANQSMIQDIHSVTLLNKSSPT